MTPTLNSPHGAAPAVAAWILANTKGRKRMAKRRDES